MAAFANLNGQRVSEGRICIPSYGIWMADVTVAGTPTLPTTPGGLTLTAGDLVLLGTAIRSGVFGGSTLLRIVGGYGGWRTYLAKGQSWHFSAGVPLSMVLGDVAAGVGEKVTGASGNLQTDCAIKGGELASLALHQLAAPYWYMAPSGVTTVGKRSSKAIGSTFQVTDSEPSAGRYALAVTSLADFAPGNTFVAPTIGTPAPISYVEFELPDSGAARAEVLVQ